MSIISSKLGNGFLFNNVGSSRDQEHWNRINKYKSFVFKYSLVNSAFTSGSVVLVSGTVFNDITTDNEGSIYAVGHHTVSNVVSGTRPTWWAIKGTNNGQSWAETDSFIGNSFNSASANGVAVYDSYIFVVGHCITGSLTNNSCWWIRHSHDKGSTWITDYSNVITYPLERSGSLNKTIMTISSSENVKDQVYGVGYYGNKEYSQLGHTQYGFSSSWIITGTYIPSSSPTEYLNIDLIHGNFMDLKYICGYESTFGFVRLYDENVTQEWKTIWTGSYSPANPEIFKTVRIDFNSDNLNSYYTSSLSVFVGGGTNGSPKDWCVYKSIGGMENFFPVDRYDVDGSCCNDIVIDNNGIIYAVGKGISASLGSWLVRKSVNKGLTWTLVDEIYNAEALAATLDITGNLVVCGRTGSTTSGMVKIYNTANILTHSFDETVFLTGAYISEFGQQLFDVNNVPYSVDLLRKMVNVKNIDIISSSLGSQYIFKDYIETFNNVISLDFSCSNAPFNLGDLTISLQETNNGITEFSNIRDRGSVFNLDTGWYRFIYYNPNIMIPILSSSYISYRIRCDLGKIYAVKNVQWNFDTTLNNDGVTYLQKLDNQYDERKYIGFPLKGVE